MLVRRFGRRTGVPLGMGLLTAAALARGCSGTAAAQSVADRAVSPHALDGERLFARETFGGNGRTCATCHGLETGTVSPEEALERLCADPLDPLFLHDGSDDGQGNGVTRMLEDATVLVEVPLPPNVHLKEDPAARSVVLRRGIPTTLNTPALDPVLMLDGRAPTLTAQAAGAITDHAQATRPPEPAELRAIAEFQRQSAFFTSPALEDYALGGPAPGLPEGTTESERRGRRFFEDLPSTGPSDTSGLCATCHSGPLLNQTNQFLPLPLPAGSRFQSVLVSELNEAGNPLHDFVFDNPDGSQTLVSSPDPGRALITGLATDVAFENVNAFKIPSLRGIRRTAPYFHDNSAKSLEEVAAHYKRFFEIASDLDGTGPTIVLSDREQADIVAYLLLL